MKRPYTRTNNYMRAVVNISISFVDEWGVRGAAEYMMRRHVPLHVAMRTLTGRTTACN